MAYGEKDMGGGRAASHATSTSLPVYAATSTGGEKTVIKEELKTVDCWRLDDVRFKFGSAFVKPESKAELEELKVIRDANVGAPLSVFGHADPVGDEEFNKTLSGWRAEAVYAVLVREPARWERIWASDGWGQTEIDVMLKATAGGGTPTVQAFQTANGLPADGAAGPQTRATLFAKYMEYLFPQKLEKTEFLGKGADAGGKGDFQGCGEFNPAMLFSTGELSAFASSGDTSTKNRQNGVNRRVMVLFFRPGTTAAGDQWPCPRASEGTAGCRKRFWSDEAVRRSNQANHREFVTTKDTFGCRFYHRLVEVSSCEAPAVAPTGLMVTGRLYWNRTWDYNDEKKKYGPVKEYLPGAKVELFVGGSAATLARHAVAHLDDGGVFEFSNVPESAAAELKIWLEYKENRVVVVKGKSNHADEPRFAVKKDEVVWHQMVLDATPLQNVAGPDVDLGKIEITYQPFVDICDAYKSVWLGHWRIQELTSENLPLCTVVLPSGGGSSQSGKTMRLAIGDVRDQDPILHEYGHFITYCMLGGLPNTGYEYNDGKRLEHGEDTLEHYEDSWLEGLATFLSAVMADDGLYHDGYDGDLSMDLEDKSSTLGPHNEASIHCALWRIHNHHKVAFRTGFWKAFTDQSIRKCNTIFDFYDNWKDLGCPDLDKVRESFVLFNLEYGYRYRDGAEMFTCVAPPKRLNVVAKEFQTVEELFIMYASLDVIDPDAYGEEFYNRNKQFNPGALGPGSDRWNIVLQPGTRYIVPERIRLAP